MMSYENMVKSRVRKLNDTEKKCSYPNGFHLFNNKYSLSTSYHMYINGETQKFIYHTYTFRSSANIKYSFCQQTSFVIETPIGNHERANAFDIIRKVPRMACAFCP